ncbi:hypothetical protein GQ44DRAFT_617243 [Phaeosphaeriaceae sp. PMI808]|nr:hypothetical protein GQ44DRAFT_617243 [Phaeosphaeriaceae sp. PMI808]
MSKNNGADGSRSTEITPLPTAMTAAACLGIAWYICIELNVRLLVRSTRRSLYFWSCLTCSWGIIIHLLFILLLNFKIFENYGALVVVHFTWCIYVVSQSVVLYSRLNLVLKNFFLGRCVLFMIIFTGIFFGLTTVVLGLIARRPNATTHLQGVNMIWDKVQLGIFFVQETLISILYINETSAHLKNMSLLGTDRKTTRRVLHHLIYVNVFIICLDCSLIGLCYSGFFFLQGFYKAAIYAIKLRTEFAILNQLRSALPGGTGYTSECGHHTGGQSNFGRNIGTKRPESQDSDVEMVGMEGGDGGKIRVRNDIVITTTRSGVDQGSKEGR